MSIKIRARVTSETVVDDVEVHHQRHRTRHICKVGGQFDVPTILTPTFSHLLCFQFVCCTEKVSELINHPVESLVVFRVGGSCIEMITKSI